MRQTEFKDSENCIGNNNKAAIIGSFKTWT